MSFGLNNSYWKIFYRIGLAAFLVSCSSTYRDNKTVSLLHTHKDLIADYNHLSEGQYTAIEYRHSSQLRARWGKVYDGGSGQTLYVVFIDPTILNKRELVPWTSPALKVHYKFHADPGLYDSFNGENLSKGYLKIISYEPGVRLRAEISIPAQHKNQAFHALKTSMNFTPK